MKRNLLFIIPSLGIGGAENAISKITLELAKRHNVYLCIFNQDIPIGFPYGGQLISLDIAGGDTVIQKALNLWRRVKKLRELKKQLKIDASVSFLEGADFINVLSRREENVIISIRSSKTHNESIIGHFDFVRNRILIPRLYRHADAIVAVQQNIVSELINQFGLPTSKITVINNFFDKEYILGKVGETLDSRQESIFNFPVIIAAGRLTEIKGFSYLIEAFSLLNKRLPNAKLVILGDGPLRSVLEEKALNTGLKVTASWNQNGLENAELASIAFLGHQRNPYKFISRSKVFMLSSLSEGFPNAMVEAMVCGIPVASTDCPYGPREILAPGTAAKNCLEEIEFADHGILLPLASEKNAALAVKVWAEAWEKLLTNKELHVKYVVQGKRRADDFSKSEIITQWEQILGCEGNSI